MMANPTRILRTVLHLGANEMLTRVRSISGFVTPGECSQIIEMSSPQSGEGTAGTSALQSRWIFPGPDSEWLYAKLDMTLKEVNKDYGFDLKGFYHGAEVIRLGTGEEISWQVDIGAGVTSTRKLSVYLKLSEATACDGGALEFRAGGYTPQNGAGTLAIFPSYLEYRISPVTRGECICLRSWIAGPPFK